MNSENSTNHSRHYVSPAELVAEHPWLAERPDSANNYALGYLSSAVDEFIEGRCDTEHLAGALSTCNDLLAYVRKETGGAR